MTENTAQYSGLGNTHIIYVDLRNSQGFKIYYRTTYPLTSVKIFLGNSEPHYFGYMHPESIANFYI